MKLFYFLMLMQILPSGLKGRNLDSPLLSMIKQANNTCVVYDFEDNRIRTGKPGWSDKERGIVLQALNMHGFTYNGAKDTLLIYMSYVDYLVPAYPVYIGAYSSCGELHLKSGEGGDYE